MKMNVNDVRLTWMHLEKPRAAAEGATPKYSLAMIIPKEREEQVAKIRAALAAVKKEKFGEAPSRGIRSPLKDGDALDEDGKRLYGQEFANAYILSATSVEPIEVVAGKAKGPATREHMRWGNYGCVQVNFKAYDKGNKGVACYADRLWITRPGEPLGSAAEPWDDNVPAEDFGAIAEQATAGGKQEGDFF